MQCRYNWLCPVFRTLKVVSKSELSPVWILVPSGLQTLTVIMDLIHMWLNNRAGVMNELLDLSVYQILHYVHLNADKNVQKVFDAAILKAEIQQYSGCSISGLVRTSECYKHPDFGQCWKFGVSANQTFLVSEYQTSPAFERSLYISSFLTSLFQVLNTVSV